MWTEHTFWFLYFNSLLHLNNILKIPIFQGGFQDDIELSEKYAANSESSENGSYYNVSKRTSVSG